MKLRAASLVVVLMASVVPLFARGKAAPKEPGTYKS